MRKILLSAAVVAASGAYVGYQNYLAPVSPVSDAGGVPAPATTKEAPPPSASAASPAMAGQSGLATIPLDLSAAPFVGTFDGSIPTIGFLTPNDGEPTSDVPSAASMPRAGSSVPPVTQVAGATTQAASARYRDGTFKGTDVNAYYGRVQVEVVIKGGRITSVNAIDYPSDRRTSRYINGQALPALEQEAIQAQNANIDIVSGATLTSEAYAQSLDAALSSAAGAGSNA